MIKNRSGMSLIELVVALGIGAVMLTVMGLLASSTISMFSHADKNSNVSDLYEAVRATLASKSQCTDNLKSTAISLTNTDGVSLPQIGSYDLNNNLASPIIETTKQYQGITVSKILLKPIAQVTSDLLVANVEVTFDKSSGIQTGVSEFIRIIPIFAHIQAGQITDCWSKKQEGISTDASMICEESSNGATSTYDPVTKTCVPDNGTWYAGSLTSATCPAGTKLLKDAGPYSACKGNVDPNYWDDPMEQVSVQMQDGSVTLATRTPMIQDLQNGTCLCHWASDLPATSLTNATCQILCFKK